MLGTSGFFGVGAVTEDLFNYKTLATWINHRIIEIY